MRHCLPLRLLLIAILLTACGPSAGSTPVASAPTAPPTLPTIIPTALPTAPPSGPGGAPVTLPQPAQGQQVLLLDKATVGRTHAFRIGGDGSIRVLDNLNNRLLFFNADGSPNRTIPLPLPEPGAGGQDFIINREGEIFVLYALPNLEDPQASKAVVLRLRSDGTEIERLPAAPGPDILTMTAGDDLLLSMRMPRLLTITTGGANVPAEAQPLTERVGLATPRSPMIFAFGYDDLSSGIDPWLRVSNLASTQQVAMVRPQIPNRITGFMNVDRAMNLYFHTDWGSDQISFTRNAPDGAYLGGVTISQPGCSFFLRSLYIDQAGAAWTMCSTEQGTAITRYQFLDPQGQPLPEAAPEPADVPWRPGATINLNTA
ncbi:MAG: hypothetical protein H0T53_01915 [Herpetosiphonaceae bacterium]|nr:hypothetical protein [Herpetosiphonaceae bacterium]